MKRACLSIIALLAGLLAVRSAWSQEAKPLPPREATEWCSINSYDANRTDLPRVLLIGDSITGRYASTVRAELKDKAYLTVLSTSKAVGDPALLDEVKTACNQYTYAAVHFNIGLHGGGGAAVYKEHFPALISTIKEHAPGAKLIWATCTPCEGEGSMAKRAVEYNAIAAEFIAKEGIPVDDLYTLAMSNINDPKLMWDGSGVHFTEEGAALQGKQVAQSILSVLPVKP